ncbi:ZN574 protein, partial [Orthonyx spaldingii]|nr:ZN574 protein [Orthonyx spaldingii]
MTKFLYHRRSHSGAAGSGGGVPVAAPAEAPEAPEMPLECGMCPKAFPNAAALARHQRFVHRLERRHRC